MIEGVRVVSFAHYLQGPSGVQMLADLGADVVKVEPPVGAFERHWSGAKAFVQGESVFFLLANRNQRSLAIDVKASEGQDIVRRLIQSADVLVENFRPGVMARLGFSYEACQDLNRRLIYVSCSGYGAEGPYRDRPGQDLLIQALSGLASITGQQYGPPTPVGTAIVDQHGAALLAVGVLAALLERVRTGVGRKVEVNLLNAALDLQIESLTYFMNGGDMRERSAHGLGSTFHEAPYGMYEARDGWIALSLGPITRLAKALDLPELAQVTPTQQYDQRENLAAIVEGRIRERTRAEWAERFSSQGIWFAVVQNYTEVIQDPQIEFNRVFATVMHPDAGPITLMNHPVRFDGEAPPIRRYPPRLGEHSIEILQSLGLMADDIDRLVQAGVVKSWMPKTEDDGRLA